MKIKKTKKNNRVIILLFFIFSYIFYAPCSYAQVAVFDSAVYTQTLQNYMELVSQIKLLQEQANELNQSLKAIQTLGKGQYQWSDVSNQINQLGAVIESTRGLSYSASHLTDQFQKAYPGYESPHDYNQQYEQNLNTTLNTLNGSLQSLHMSAEDFTNEPKRIEFLKSQVQNAQGQTQAIQASAQISTEVISQLQLLRQTLMTESNAQGVYLAQQTQSDASDEAGFHQMLTNGSTQWINYGQSGHTIQLPEWH